MNSKRIAVLASLGLALLLASAAHAGPLTIPNTFNANSPASATQVNANFTAVKTAFDANDTRIASLEAQTAAKNAWFIGLNGVCARAAASVGLTGVFVAAAGIRVTGKTVTANTLCGSVNLGRSWAFGDGAGNGRCFAMIPVNGMSFSSLATVVDPLSDFAPGDCTKSPSALSSDWADVTNNGWVACCR